MRIAFDHQIFTIQSYGGISRYFVRLVQGLLALGETANVLAPIHHNHYLGDLPKGVVHGLGFKSFPPKTHRIVTEINRQICAARLRRLRPEILHETYYATAPVGGTFAGRVLTVYDMIHERFPKEFDRNDPTSQRKRSAVARADHIICISHSTKSDLCQMFDLPSERVSVVHLGFDHLMGDALAEVPIRVGDRPFLLYVGHREGYKNFARTVRAVASCAVLREAFDIVAFGGGAFRPQELGLIQSLGLRDGAVRQLGGDDAVLGSLYGRAAALVYPSLYEGFGLPPLEAMAHDCPVITSNVSSMPEVVGQAGAFFDPSDVEAQAEAIRSVVCDTERRLQLVALGRVRLSNFSWSSCAMETRAVYRDVMEMKEIR